MSEPTADRNLLFGILALQMDFINRDALIKAMNAWVLEKAKPLGQILQEQGVLRNDNRELLEALVQRHLELHDNDPEKSLASVSSFHSAREELQQITDAALQASLAVVSSAAARGPEYTVDEVRPAGLRYRILRPHARGGLGEVFIAEDQELHREVALKEIQPRHAHDPISRGRFLLEAEVTGRLEHPGIVPVYGLGQYDDGRPFYAMRFIQGDNLKEAIRRFHEADKPGRDLSERSLEFRQLLGRFVDVCDAIAYAHSRGVLHRDLKPGNIMLGKYGETLVVDWGLAKPIDCPEPALNADETTFRPSSGSGLLETQMGAAIGTPAYMSPEQAAGRLDRVGPASDVYSLGATLYALLTGQAPFQEGDAGSVLQKVQRGDIVWPRQVKPGTPAALEAICRQAMALNPEERYPTALALAADVEHWLADEPVSAYREPWRVKLGRWLKRHRTGVIAAAAALGVALLSLAVLAVVLTTANQQLRAANARAEANYREAERQKREVEQAVERERKARETAQANYQLARGAVEQYLAKVTDDPRLNEVGLRGLRRELLEEAGKFYTRFIEERGNDPRLRADLATAYFKSAFIASEMGTRTQALERYQQAAAILEELIAAHPEGTEYHRDLARAYHYLGAVQTDAGQLAAAQKSYEQARAIREKLTATQPDVPEYQNDLARTYNNLAVVLNATGQPAAGDQSLDQAHALFEKLAAAHPEVHEYQYGLAGSYLHLGGRQFGLGQLAAARKSYEQAQALFEKLVPAHPEVPQYQRYLAKAYGGLGNVYWNLGQRATALKANEQARVLQRKLATAHPEVPWYQAELASTHQNRGFMQRILGQGTAALLSYERARDLLEKLTAAQPEVTEYQGDLARAYNHLGILQQALGQRGPALKSYEQARALWEKLTVAHPDASPYQTQLAGAYHQLGLLQRTLGQRDVAFKSHEEARVLREKLAADHPDVAEYQSDLAATYHNLGILHSDTGQRAAALQSFEQARGLREKLVTDHPDISSYQRELALIYYDLGCFYALSSAASRQDAQLPQAERERLGEHYTSLALGFLSKAQAAGYFKDRAHVEHMKKDTDLDAIRAHDGFKKLVKELEEPVKEGVK